MALFVYFRRTSRSSEKSLALGSQEPGFGCSLVMGFFWMGVGGLGSTTFLVALVTSLAVSVCWVVCLWAVATPVPVFPEVRDGLVHHSVSEAGTVPGT